MYCYDWSKRGFPFALFKGYVDVVLGLLGEDEAATLILETAELEPTESGIAAAKIVAKLAGYLVRLPETCSILFCAAVC